MIPELSGMSCVTNQNEVNRSGSQSLSVSETNNLLDNPNLLEFVVNEQIQDMYCCALASGMCVCVCIHALFVCTLRPVRLQDSFCRGPLTNIPSLPAGAVCKCP